MRPASSSRSRTPLRSLASTGCGSTSTPCRGGAKCRWRSTVGRQRAWRLTRCVARRGVGRSHRSTGCSARACPPRWRAQERGGTTWHRGPRRVCRAPAVAAHHASGGPDRYAALATLRDELEGRVLGMTAGVHVNGAAARAPHVSNLAFPRWTGPEARGCTRPRRGLGLERVRMQRGDERAVTRAQRDGRGGTRDTERADLAWRDDDPRGGPLRSAGGLERVLSRGV